MNFTTFKLMLTALFGFALMGISQITYAGWDSGQCASSGPPPCIEYQDNNGDWFHFNGQGGHAGNWHNTPSNANPADADLEFCGSTRLECSSGTYDCELCLDGEVRKFQKNSTWHIGVRVNSSTVSAGNWECAFISPGSFPWYVNKNGAHTYGPNSGIEYVSGANTYTGSVGAIDITALGSTVVDQGHIHDVVFSNADSSFTFDGTLWEDGADHTDSGCTVTSTETTNLQLQNGQDINIK